MFYQEEEEKEEERELTPEELAALAAKEECCDEARLLTDVFEQKQALQTCFKEHGRCSGQGRLLASLVVLLVVLGGLQIF